jgi:hypothetical protein
MATQTTSEEHRWFWEKIRHIIEAEDIVINHRLTWALVINGFLLAAVASLAVSLQKADHASYRIPILVALLLALTVVGSLVCQVAANLLRVPLHHHYRIRRWWEQYCATNRIDPSHYPPVTGWKTEYNELKMHSLHLIPVYLLYFWGVANAMLSPIALLYALQSDKRYSVLCWGIPLVGAHWVLLAWWLRWAARNRAAIS